MSQHLCSVSSLVLAVVLPACGLALGEDANPVETAPALHPPRVECIRLTTGAELITIFERLPVNPASPSNQRELPLMAILKDTLNDSDPTNDRIRQVWVFTYSQPS